MKEITLYTDGSSKGNPGPGGLGVVLIYNGNKKEIAKGFRLTTNNRMELSAVIEGLAALKEPCKVTVYTDSKYIVDAFGKGWIDNWLNSNWVKKDKKPVLNVDLWQKLLELMEQHDVTFQWVKGHASNPVNNRCDELAVSAASGKNLLVDEGYKA